jgi:hypothetical protein
MNALAIALVFFLAVAGAAVLGGFAAAISMWLGLSIGTFVMLWAS